MQKTFNIHVESYDASSLRFNEILELFDLRQHIVGPTHKMGHTIDVVITRNMEPSVEDISITEIDLSHHYLIDFVFKLELKKVLTKTINYRNIKGVHPDLFS